MTGSVATGDTSVPLLEQTIGANLEATAARFPDREAIVSVHQGVRMTYAEFDAEVDLMASRFLAEGFAVGDRLGIWAPNCIEWALVQYATAKIGVILVNVNPAYRTHELEYALRQSGCRGIVAATEFKGSDYVAMVASIRESLPGVQFVWHIGDDDWHHWLEHHERASVEQLRERSASLSPTDPINIQYTSGTTGFPKGATLSHRNILNNGFFVGEGCGYTEHDRVCIPVPLYHCFGMVMGNLGCTTHGATIVYPNDAFDPLATLRTIQDERCTSLYGVPTMFIAELGHPRFGEFDLTSLRTGIMAGSPCPVEVMKQTISAMHMSEVTICYGMTETSPVSTQTGPDDTIDQRVGSVGRVHPHVEIRIVSPDAGPDGDTVVGRGETGEFCTRGYSVMLGYWDDPARTAEAIDADGWMHTGDLATMDADGYVNIVGRIKDMVIRGGENIYPREVEEFLYGHPDIVDVQVIGVPDVKYGEELMAWVRLRDGAEPLSADDIRDYCRGRIAHFKIPRYVHVTDEFPMTVTGKVQKYKMRDAAIELLGLHGAAGIDTA
jgi:fatty-acyl-CoA synthase